MNWMQCMLVQRLVTALAGVALVVSGIVGCATKPSYYARIEGIVVDGQRLAGEAESGLVGVTRDGRTVEGRAGMELRRGDIIVTGPRAEAVVGYASGSRLYLRQNSSGRIGSFFDMLGEAFASIRGRFTVETTFVRAGVKGTQFLVRAFPGGETTVIVFDGSVSVDSTRGDWPTVTLGPGQMVIAHPQPPRPMSAGEAELQSTRSWVERIERLVPPQTTMTSSTGAAIAAAGVAVAVAAILANRNRSRDAAPPPAPEPADARRGASAGSAPTGPAGVDRPRAQEATPASPLAAPTNPQPGGAPNSPAVQICDGGVPLSWTAVRGARSYEVRLEQSFNRGRTWLAVATLTAASNKARTAALSTDAIYRWQVLARDGNRVGPPSPWAYFNCVSRGAPR